MNTKRAGITLGVFLLVVLAWWLWVSMTVNIAQQAPETKVPVVVPRALVPPSNVPTAPTPEEYPQMTGGRSTGLQDPRWQRVNDLDKTDPGWQGRIPIKFYGKVIDQNNVPVEGATASFVWTDLSPNGTSSAKNFSGPNGLFKLENARGKNLGVEVSKAGYIPLVENRSSFEYAGFWAETFHEPDANNPVIFRMQKKGEGAALTHRESEITVGLGQRSSLRLDGKTQIEVELTTNGEIYEKNWAARVTMNGGGIQLSADEFPFDAPEAGYQSSLALDLKTPKPPNWGGLYQGGQFYVKTADGKYGRIELKTVPGKTFMRYSFFLNPTLGSRNLEFDPAKAVKSP